MPVSDALIDIAVDLFKALLPGSVLFLLIGLTVGVGLLLTGQGRRTGARLWLAGLAVLYWVLSLPIVANGMDSLLGGGYQPLASATAAGEARTVVVLTGGGLTLYGEGGTFDVLSTASVYRMLEAERVYHLLDEPLLVISGGPAGGVVSGNPESEAMRAQLVARGIPETKILLETEAADTRRQAILVGELLERQGIDAFVLITSTQHMRRALGTFAEQGMTPVPSAAREPATGDGLPGARLLPSAEALGRSYLAIREGFALLYYAVRGWMG